MKKIHWQNSNTFTACTRRQDKVNSTTFDKFSEVDETLQCKTCLRKWKEINKVNQHMIPYHMYKGNIHKANWNWLSDFFLCKITLIRYNYRIDYIKWHVFGLNDDDNGIDIIRNRAFAPKDLYEMLKHTPKLIPDEESKRLKKYYKFMSI
jgi:hypothetical protein